MDISLAFRALIGGVLIGFAAVLLLFADGKIAGISGMIGGVMRTPTSSSDWRYAFLGGMIIGGWVLQRAGVIVFTPAEGRSLAAIIAAGLLVGFGTQIGSGCTSGHGVCGIGRFSMRSIVATLIFIAAGAITVFVVRHFLGGVL